MVDGFKKKIFRWLAKNGFPNKFRIWCLRKAGVKIGSDVYIGEGFTMACVFGYESNLVIEDRVSIGPNVTVIITSDPNNSILKKYRKKYPFIDIKGKITIKHDAWIGACAILMPNITIGEYSVIGAGSVVTKSVPQKTVVAGVPARKMKKLDIINEE